MLSIMSVAIKSVVWKTFYSLKMNACDTVEAHSCVNIVTKFTDEQYTTIKQSTAGRFDLRVFVSCFLEIHSCTLLQLQSIQSIYIQLAIPSKKWHFRNTLQP